MHLECHLFWKSLLEATQGLLENLIECGKRRLTKELIRFWQDWAWLRAKSVHETSEVWNPTGVLRQIRPFWSQHLWLSESCLQDKKKKNKCHPDVAAEYPSYYWAHQFWSWPKPTLSSVILFLKHWRGNPCTKEAQDKTFILSALPNPTYPVSNANMYKSKWFTQRLLIVQDKEHNK